MELVPVDSAICSDGELPVVTHYGELCLDGLKIRVVQLSNGQRVIPAEEIERILLTGFGGFEEL